jgi:hypothetical protein
MDKGTDADYLPGNYATAFTFYLDSPEEEGKAKEALNSLVESLPLILAFNSRLEKVEILNNLFTDSPCYQEPQL